MIRQHFDRPNPRPRPASRPEKKGSKIFARISAGIPGPSSEMTICTTSPEVGAPAVSASLTQMSIVKLPFWPMASSEFTHNARSATRSCTASAAIESGSRRFGRCSCGLLCGGFRAQFRQHVVGQLDQVDLVPTSIAAAGRTASDRPAFRGAESLRVDRRQTPPALGIRFFAQQGLCAAGNVCQRVIEFVPGAVGKLFERFELGVLQL